MSAPETALAGLGAIPRDEDGPVFPAPWAARAFALAVALNERGVFTWSEWADALGARLATMHGAERAAPESYWLAWLAALEGMLLRKAAAGPDELGSLQNAWREAAEATPHGQAIELGPR